MGWVRQLVREPQGAAQVLRVIKVVLRVIDHGALRLAVHDPAGAGGELRDSCALGLRGEWLNDLGRSLRGIDDLACSGIRRKGHRVAGTDFFGQENRVEDCEALNHRRGVRVSRALRKARDLGNDATGIKFHARAVRVNNHERITGVLAGVDGGIRIGNLE